MASTKSKQDALIDELLQDCPDPKDILGKNGLLKQLTKRLVERTLKAELTDHLGYEPHAPEGHGSGNNRNGKSQKTVQSESGPFQIEVPRDRNGTFEPSPAAMWSGPSRASARSGRTAHANPATANTDRAA